MSTYTPRPIDTSDIKLSEELTTLLEKLAENTHDTWAEQRIKEGWTYGPERNDTKKQHPGLVAYAELTEGEKDYDRRTASETVKLIMKLGFKVTPGSPKAKRTTAAKAPR